MWSPCGFNTYRNSHLTFLECNLYRIRKNMAAFFQKKKKSRRLCVILHLIPIHYLS